MKEDDIQLGGGNVWAILTSGILMFLFYALGWGYMGTFALFVFIVIGIQSLFPAIAAFLGLLILCIYHFQEPVAIISIFFWIVLMTGMEIAARTGMLDEKEEKVSGTPQWTMKNRTDGSVEIHLKNPTHHDILTLKLETDHEKAED